MSREVCSRSWYSSGLRVWAGKREMWRGLSCGREGVSGGREGVRIGGC